jgi:putative ABC transport system permease protein
MQISLFFEFAMRNVRLHWLRSILGIIGTVIGVTAIVSMGILGYSLGLAISDSLSTVGDSVIVTPPHGTGPVSVSSTNERITERQLEQIRRAVAPDITIPVYSGSARMEVGTEDTFGVVYGLRPDDIPVLLEVEEGTYLRGSSGIMAGARFAKENDLRVGSRITIKDKGTLRVVGILKERGMGFDINPDYGIVVDDNWYEQVYDQNGYDLVIVKVGDLSRIEAVKGIIEKQMNRRDTVVNVIDTKAVLETILDTFGRISTFTTAIGGISLVVAGVSILNSMMMSVTERIREIGVLRSIGTLRREVLVMFLFEALILGLSGSLVGGVLSVFAGYAISLLMLQTSEYMFVQSSMVYVLYGVAFGIGTSLLSGIYPAWRASNLNPIEALRHE